MRSLEAGEKGGEDFRQFALNPYAMLELEAGAEHEKIQSFHFLEAMTVG
jgi:hypothetical protein